MKIAVVAAHGMGNTKKGIFDPGFVGTRLDGKKLREADLSLTMALTGKQVLTELGIPSYLVRRDNQENISLNDRPTLAKRGGCTHLIDLHMNAGGIPYVTGGIETFYDDLTDIPFANLVQKCAIGAFKRKSRGVKHESLSPRKSLHILNFQGQAALLEMGFLLNKGDSDAILNRDNRVRFWTLLAEELKRSNYE